MTKDDGGPAFPNLNFKQVDNCSLGETVGGMSLRDYFAVHATDEDIRGYVTISDMTRTAAKYKHADNMLEERVK